MNLDFTKPKGNAKKLADELGLDILDPQLIEGFKKLQQERIEELKKKRNPNYKPIEEPSILDEVKNPLA